MSESLDKINIKVLIGSLLLSIIFHFGEFQFLQNQTLWILSPLKKQQTNDNWINLINKQEKEKILLHTFDLLSKESLEDFSQSAKEIEPFSNPSKTELKIFDKNLLPEKISEKINSPKIIFPDIPIEPLQISLPSFSSLQNQIPLLQNLPKTARQQSLKFENPPTVSQPKQIQELFPSNDPLQTTFNPHSKTHAKNIAAPSFALKKLPLLPSFKSQTPNTTKLPTLSELKCESFSKYFETDLVFFELGQDEYLFALTLIPSSEIQSKKIQQNYIFLIDRSNSIQKDRLMATKAAVKKAIEELTPSDKFNIIAFDQKVDKLAPYTIAATEESISKAISFLDSIELGSFFSQKNLFKPLFLTVPPKSNPNEILSVILCTDGESLSDKSQVESLVKEWTNLNNGQVSLFTLCLNDDTNASLLDTIAQFNRGKSFTATTPKAIKRKLLKLMKSIQSPIAKNLHCKAISFEADEIEIFPNSSVSPHLYVNEPYVLLGTTKSLDDFVVFIQARLDNKWLHIKKNVSFQDAKKASPSIKSLWAQHKAFDLYQKYIHDADQSHLAEADQLIKTYHLQDVFERY